MIVTFFRDILDGPLYTIVCVISSLSICSCIGYLAEQKQLKKNTTEEIKTINNDKSNQTTKNESASQLNNLYNTPNTIQNGVSLEKKQDMPINSLSQVHTLNSTIPNNSLNQNVMNNPTNDILAMPQAIPEQILNSNLSQSNGTIPSVALQNNSVITPQNKVNNQNSIM